MPRTLIVMCLCIVLLTSSALSSPAPIHAQDPAAPNTFAAMLATIPDTSGNRAWLAFGDIDAWHTAWKVPRPLNLATLELLPKLPHGLWISALPYQTITSTALGMDSLLMDDQRTFYGFDYFQVDRAIEANTPPDIITVLTHHADPADIDAALLKAGYTVEDVNGWALYSLLDDYQVALNVDIPRAGQLGQRNRIALNGQQMIIARATAPITAVIGAASGAQPALADDPYYTALAAALSDPLLDGTGALVGVIAQSGLEYLGVFGAMVTGPSMTSETIQAERARYGLDDPDHLLPVFDTVIFATSHAEDASYLTLALAFPPGTDTAQALRVLEDKMPAYESLRYQAPLADRWTLDRSGAVEIAGIPVVLVVMRVENPAPPAENEQFYGNVFNWYQLIAARDVAFLATVLEAEGSE